MANILGDEERIALAVAELVDDGLTEATVLADALNHRLSLAPVGAKVLTLGDGQRVLARFEYALHFRCRRVGVRQVHDRDEILQGSLRVADVQQGELRPTSAYLRVTFVLCFPKSQRLV